MFIAWRSVTEAKNKILLLRYLSYVCVRERARQNVRNSSQTQNQQKQQQPCSKRNGWMYAMRYFPNNDEN